MQALWDMHGRPSVTGLALGPAMAPQQLFRWCEREQMFGMTALLPYFASTLAIWSI